MDLPDILSKGKKNGGTKGDNSSSPSQDLKSANEKAIKILILKDSAELWSLELRQRYLQGRVLTDRRYQQALGQMQANIKEVKDWLGFLKSELESEAEIVIEK